MDFKKLIEQQFIIPTSLIENLIVLTESSNHENQSQTNDIFSDKWIKSDDRKGLKEVEDFQKRWYLELYGFNTELDLSQFLKTKKVILDAGCGLGYKAAWFAELSPSSLVIGMDFSDAAFRAANNYKNIPNLYFVKGDISATHLKDNSVDYVSCDQVIHHTEFPEITFKHLAGLLSEGGEFACYVYAKKAVPRELLDDYFRFATKGYSKEQLWEMSEQLTILGKRLSELNIIFESPDIPLLGIKGGKYDVQRFLYWNFLKCFWNESIGYKNSIETNFDWYGPSNAYRYSEAEYKAIIQANNLEVIFFHQEEACYAGRFKK